MTLKTCQLCTFVMLCYCLCICYYEALQMSVLLFVVMCACEQGQESDSSETSVRGPRIKHVCRRAAVALGRNRAVFPDDMPTLSALPWEEREKILSSMGNDGEAHSFYILNFFQVGQNSPMWRC